MIEKNSITPQEAFPAAYGLKQADAGKGLCYTDRVADAVKEVAKTLPVENGKIIFPWPVVLDGVFNRFTDDTAPDSYDSIPGKKPKLVSITGTDGVFNQK